MRLFAGPIVFATVVGCASRPTVVRDDHPTFLQTTTLGEGAAMVRDEPDGTRTGVFAPSADDPHAHHKFVAWCAEGRRALGGACESRNADGELTSSFPETGLLENHALFGWGCVYARTEPGERVTVRVRCQ